MVLVSGIDQRSSWDFLIGRQGCIPAPDQSLGECDARVAECGLYYDDLISRENIETCMINRLIWEKLDQAMMDWTIKHLTKVTSWGVERNQHRLAEEIANHKPLACAAYGSIWLHLIAFFDPYTLLRAPKME